ncbi:MAG TPA: SGNH/GDSL hydrolase family protein [Thermoanaerobaculia bacterium]|jgi:lysophospholipase L1-like esterase
MPARSILIAAALALVACGGTGATRTTMTQHSFDRYIALGDSISIDIYPANDVIRRHAGKASTDRLGAASLLHKNDDKLWLDFRGRDLATLQPSLQYDVHRDDLTSDGATTQTLLRQVEQITPSDERTLVTITAGGNDLLGQIGSRGSNPVPEIAERLRSGVMRVLERRPNATILVSTVYDPSDGTNRLPGYTRELEQEARWLAEYNDFVRDLVKTDKRLRLADIHKHFLGHGLTVSERERWYLQESIIEPSARGASEVRRVWLDALGM